MKINFIFENGDVNIIVLTPTNEREKLLIKVFREGGSNIIVGSDPIHNKPESIAFMSKSGIATKVPLHNDPKEDTKEIRIDPHKF